MIAQAFTNAAGATVRAAKRSQRSLLLTLGALQVIVGSLVAVAPHLSTILGPRPFAVTMIVLGVGSAVLAFVKTEISQE